MAMAYTADNQEVKLFDHLILPLVFLSGSSPTKAAYGKPELSACNDSLISATENV